MTSNIFFFLLRSLSIIDGTDYNVNENFDNNNYKWLQMKFQ